MVHVTKINKHRMFNTFNIEVSRKLWNNPATLRTFNVFTETGTHKDSSTLEIFRQPRIQESWGVIMIWLRIRYKGCCFCCERGISQLLKRWAPQLSLHPCFGSWELSSWCLFWKDQWFHRKEFEENKCEIWLT